MIAAELVKRGYVKLKENELSVNVPVFTKDQNQKMNDILESAALRIADEAEKLSDTVTGILKNHLPTHLKKLARDLAYLRLFEDAISAPVAELFDRKYLLPHHISDILL